MLNARRSNRARSNPPSAAFPSPLADRNCRRRARPPRQWRTSDPSRSQGRRESAAGEPDAQSRLGAIGACRCTSFDRRFRLAISGRHRGGNGGAGCRPSSAARSRSPIGCGAAGAPCVCASRCGPTASTSWRRCAPARTRSPRSSPATATGCRARSTRCGGRSRRIRGQQRLAAGGKILLRGRPVELRIATGAGRESRGQLARRLRGPAARAAARGRARGGDRGRAPPLAEARGAPRRGALDAASRAAPWPRAARAPDQGAEAALGQLLRQRRAQPQLAPDPGARAGVRVRRRARALPPPRAQPPAGVLAPGRAGPARLRARTAAGCAPTAIF